MDPFSKVFDPSYPDGITNFKSIPLGRWGRQTYRIGKIKMNGNTLGIREGTALNSGLAHTRLESRLSLWEIGHNSEILLATLDLRISEMFTYSVKYSSAPLVTQQETV